MGADVAGVVNVEVTGTSKAEVADMLDVEIGTPAELVVPRWELVDGSDNGASS